MYETVRNIRSTTWWYSWIWWRLQIASGCYSTSPSILVFGERKINKVSRASNISAYLPFFHCFGKPFLDQLRWNDCTQNFRYCPWNSVCFSIATVRCPVSHWTGRKLWSVLTSQLALPVCHVASQPPRLCPWQYSWLAIALNFSSCDWNTPHCVLRPNEFPPSLGNFWHFMNGGHRRSRRAKEFT